MVFTALDVFSAGLPPLLDRRPAAGTPLFDYIVRRLWASWNVPGGVVRYYRGMLAGRARDGWPAVRAALDAGRPCPLGLVTVRSANPLRLGLNHLVLAYGYDPSDRGVTIRVYDPNSAVATTDDVRIRIRTGIGATAIDHNLGIDRPIRGLFRIGYTAADPFRLEPPA